MKMRIFTTEEWDELMYTVCEDNNRAYWKEMFAWVHDRKLEEEAPPRRALRGYFSPHYDLWNSPSTRNEILGFRPAFDTQETDALALDLRNGDTAIIGTLYMGGEPVKVPQDPTYDGDIADYILGAKLEMREALEDPAYQVTAIKVGDVLLVDRCLVRNISYNDIQTACTDD